MTGDSATNILKASGEPNTFVVYMDQDRGIYMLAMRLVLGSMTKCNFVVKPRS